MTLRGGTRLGPYEILSPLGAGGMGEVYRAKDPRLGREVAVKVLPASLSKDPDRLRRFEHEARAAGVLNHPNITAVYDIGSHDGAPYVVSELLEGETLRSRLAAGALAPRKALDYAIQIARGLAAAHEKGIVHRDLKPENLFVTEDGRVKILDFGLAKLKPELKAGEATELPTATAGTEPGVVLGTMGYMSPEQVRGRPADARSDIFAFGAILYEMLSGKRAFHADTAADTITAILTKEPPDLSQTNRDIHPGLDRIVRHCLEKNPQERFQSARDVAFDLEALSGVSGAGAVAAVAVPSARKVRLPLIPVAALVLGAIAGLLAGKKVWERPLPSFHQLTFRRGEIPSARFAPDGQTIFYTAAWEGRPMEIFTSRVETPESRPFGLPGADVLSVSRSGELAVSLDRRATPLGFIRTGTLARVSVAGGAAPRDVLEDVQWADWAPDGQSFAVVRDVGGVNRLEYPIGTVLYQTTGWISHPRISSGGDRIAFLDHLVKGDDGGTVGVVDRKGNRKTLSRVFASIQGLAWSPGGEVWFTGATRGNRDLYSVTLSGVERARGRVAGNLTLHDISSDGRALVVRDTPRIGSLGLFPGGEKEREMTWLDWSVARDLSADGKTLLFFESGEGGGVGYSVYLRKTDGSPPVRLGEGSGEALSPDGRWVLSAIDISREPKLVAYPTGAGELRRFPSDGLSVQVADFTPDGKQVVFSANEPGRGGRIYVRDFAGGKPRPVTPEGYRMWRRAISPDGRLVVATGPDQRIYLYPLAGGEPTPLPGTRPGDIPDRWTVDGRSLYVHRRDELPVKVYLLDVATGKKELWKELIPADSAGVTQVAAVVPTPDGRSYVYSYIRLLSDMYVVEGLK
ncbi:MAG TPA: protein kinase [Thermoanaerobaculia bacterium]|nr:protein kinase [Thermoanaerobaculia bacterium]